MTLKVVNIISYVISKLPIKKKLPCDNKISCRQIFTVNSKQTSMLLFTLCSFLNRL